MPTTLTVSPMTRVEGHLDVQVVVDTVSAVQQVTSAKVGGMSFRGFEIILQGRDPLDAPHYTQRICGVCPISHGMASTKALEAAFAMAPTDNGRILRNLMLGANFIQSHILHTYHLAAPDYIDTTGLLDMSPWTPRFTSPDMIGGATASTLVSHYVTALDMRRKAHRMGAIFAGRMPTTASFVPSGSSAVPTATDITNFRALLTELRAFINNTMIPDVQALAAAFPQYSQIGHGCGNLLAYGVFDQNAAGTSMLLARGRYTAGAMTTVDTTQIREFVKNSWYTAASGNLAPTAGVTQPSATKAGAYSWVKAPRYANLVHEVGPLARMWVNGDYRTGISVIDRLAARALEAKKVADAMDGWLTQFKVGTASYTYKATPAAGTGVGLTEAPRGALGHWVTLAAKKISRYQIITPTAWNASPADDAGKPGAMEQALTGTPVKDLTNPVEVLRVVHSFDPCLSCSVHMARPGKKAEVVLTV